MFNDKKCHVTFDFEYMCHALVSCFCNNVLVSGNV